MAAADNSREMAFLAFEAEFTRNGFQVPQGLVKLLRKFSLKREETPLQGRARMYRRLWALLWFGSQKSLGAHVAGGKPTYVFPPSLKRVVREVIPGRLEDQPDPTHERVYQVNIGDLARARWPA